MTIYPVPKPVPVAEKDRPPRQKNRKPLKRTRLKSRGSRTKKSGGHLFPRNVDLAYRAFIRTLPCILAGRMGRVFGPDSYWFTEIHLCTSRTRCCHLRARGAGGPDVGNTWPGCDAAHDEQHRIGIPAFQKRWNLKLEHIAAGLALRYQETGGM